MSEFDPSKPGLVHDELNDKTIDWQPELYLEHFREYARLDFDPEKGLVEWGGLLPRRLAGSASAAIMTRRATMASALGAGLFYALKQLPRPL